LGLKGERGKRGKGKATEYRAVFPSSPFTFFPF
jgi:hypothetical protein